MSLIAYLHRCTSVWRGLFGPSHTVSDESDSRGWGQFPERLADGRGTHTHLNHL